MRKAILVVTLITGGIVSVLVSCQTSKADNPVTEAVTKDSLIKRGAYLVATSGCDDCHSPKKMGPQGPELVMERRFSGYPADRPYPKYDSNVIKKGLMLFNEDLTSGAGPWGVSFAANLTSDATGIGNWTEAQFFKALREGKFKGLATSRNLLPPMPWQNLKQMTDEDLRAMYTYLKSTKPVNNIVPAPMQLAQLK